MIRLPWVRRFLLVFAVLTMSGCVALSEAGRADRDYTRTLFMAIDAVALIDEAERIAVEYDVPPPKGSQNLRDRAADLILEAEAMREDAVDEAMSKSIFSLPAFKKTESRKQLKRAHEEARQLLIEAQQKLIRVQTDAGVLVLTPEVLVPVEIG